MAKKSLFCIIDSEERAASIVTQLKEAGFSSNDISALLPDKTGTKDFAHEQHTKAPEGATAGAGLGGLVGGALGWMAGIGALAVPGLGPFIAAGPIMGALSGVAVGGAAGGLVGVLIGYSIPEYEAKRYEGKIKDGNILVSIHTETSDDQFRARKTLERHNAKDIVTAGEEDVPSDQATT